LKEYNGTTVAYSIDFDSTIVKLQTEVEGVSEGEITEELRNDYGTMTERWRNDGGTMAERWRNDGGTISDAIIGIIKTSPQITVKELSEKIGVPTRTVERTIKKLKTAGIIERIGPKLGGHWEVVSK
jgi:predicted HTH transcriptional regulator